MNQKSLEKLRKRLSCKPLTFKEAKLLHTKTVKETELIYELPLIEIKLDSPQSDLPKGTPQWFVLGRGWGKTARYYLVNTEGYDYPKYLARLGRLAYKRDSALHFLASM